MSFVESYADLAAYHVVPIRAFHDGICSPEKALEAKTRWPDREVLAEVDGVGSVEVTVDARAQWWPGMIAASARQRLRAVRPL